MSLKCHHGNVSKRKELGSRGSELFPLRIVPYVMKNHFYHIRWPPLNFTIFITHVRNCEMGATPMLLLNHLLSLSIVYRRQLGPLIQCIPSSTRAPYSTYIIFILGPYILYSVFRLVPCPLYTIFNRGCADHFRIK